MEKQCPNCKTIMFYNNHYHCYQCNCGKTYNAFLQELRPLKDWKDEYEEEYY